MRKPESLALLTDFYQLTMAYAAWKNERCRAEGVFHMMFRQNPFGGGFTVLAGVADCISFVRDFRFQTSDLDYLAGIKSSNQSPMFEEGFLRYLADLKIECDIDAPLEGTVVFPHQPILRVKGPLVQGQLLETALLNFINFQSLIATKAARVVEAAGKSPVMEFGLRRAQGIDGAISATRAAFVGGVTSTSNVLAAKLFDIPVQGTHAHSWVMSYDDETQAFRAFAQAMPDDCVFLVDTFYTLEGVRRAVEVALELRQQGRELKAIRLDSGDLAYLSVEARKLLDAADLKNVKIIATNDLDESVIESLIIQGAKIDIWGVGTKLVTGYDQPALGAVYKLGAFRETPESPWKERLKLSEQTAKISSPGILRTRRFSSAQGYIADAVYDERHANGEAMVIVDPLDPTKLKTFPPSAQHEELLVPLFRQGQYVGPGDTLQAARSRAREQISRLHPGIRRFKNPHVYPVGLEQNLYMNRIDLILKLRKQGPLSVEGQL